MMKNRIDTVGVVGLGLIGGSMAKAIRQYTDCTLLGYDADGAALGRALDEGVASAPLTPDRLAECQLVIIALYPQATVAYVTAHRDQFRPGGIVMDCGGVKGVVCTPLEEVTRNAGFTFVGGHPMAGVERSGYANAFPELFQGASLILTPYSGTPQGGWDSGISSSPRRRSTTTSSPTPPSWPTWCPAPTWAAPRPPGSRASPPGASRI